MVDFKDTPIIMCRSHCYSHLIYKKAYVSNNT